VNVYFHTFGCKANQYDTALVRQAYWLALQPKVWK